MQRECSRRGKGHLSDPRQVKQGSEGWLSCKKGWCLLCPLRPLTVRRKAGPGHERRKPQHHKWRCTERIAFPSRFLSGEGAGNQLYRMESWNDRPSLCFCFGIAFCNPLFSRQRQSGQRGPSHLCHESVSASVVCPLSNASGIWL